MNERERGDECLIRYFTCVLWKEREREDKE